MGADSVFLNTEAEQGVQQEKDPRTGGLQARIKHARASLVLL